MVFRNVSSNGGAVGRGNHLTEWMRAWRAARSHQLFYLGSKDETAGNQSCVATLQKDGTGTLQLRHPDNTLKGADRYLNLAGSRFPHGHPQLAAALAQGQALSYRFHRDERDWLEVCGAIRCDRA
jgi:hypothetical protein